MKIDTANLKLRKILYIVSTLKKSGPTNQLFNIIKSIDRTVFEPVLVTLSSEPKDSKWWDYESLGIEMHSLSLSRMAGILFAKVKLRKIIKIIRPNLIHTQGIRADVLSSRLNIDIPKVSTIRNFPQKDFPMTYGRFLGEKMARHQILALKKIDKCIGVSEAVVTNLINTYGINGAEVIRNGVDTEIYLPVNDSVKIDLRIKLGLPLEANVWIVSGDLIERKDPLFLINAWKKFFANKTNQCLILIGEGDLQEKCLKVVEDANNILVIGRVAKVVEYLHASDYYLAASKAEGMPNAALEALACGLPLLLSDIGPHKELVQIDGQIGLTYQVGNQDDFYFQLNKMMTRDYDSMRSACLNLISTMLSASVMSKKYQVLYLNLLGRF